MSYATSMARVLRGEGLPRPEAESLMHDLLSGELSAVKTAAALTALASKGATVDEVVGFATVMRGRAIPVSVPGDPIDTCGTGGSGLETLNTSTMVAFVAAAAGAKVVKHGNRASTGKCGSMDVLERLGVDIELSPELAETIAADAPFIFLNARSHHPALGPLAPIRKELGFRTVFNLLGPLCNPAGLRRQVLGVSDRDHARTLAHALARLGVDRALVVSGADGLDELSLHGPSHLFDISADATVRETVVSPEDIGLETVALEDLSGGDVETNAAWFRKILCGEDDGPRAHHTALNAGAALVVAGLADDLRAGVERALEVLRSGTAYRELEQYATRSSEATA
jgi:anthranilate phosphoribosyltransferase